MTVDSVDDDSLQKRDAKRQKINEKTILHYRKLTLLSKFVDGIITNSSTDKGASFIFAMEPDKKGTVVVDKEYSSWDCIFLLGFFISLASLVATSSNS
jgi:hypothetical protein